MRIEIKILNKEFYTTTEKDYTHRAADTELYRYKLPSYATPGSAAMDLVCTQDVTIYPGETKAIHTGLAIHIGGKEENSQFGLISPGANRGHRHDLIDYIGIAGIVLPRSGLGTRGLVLANTVGVIDDDYQGELIVQAWNRLDDIRTCERKKANVIELKAGDRFAQLAFVPVIKSQWDVVEEFSSITERNTGGFGSTDANGKPKC